MATTNFKTQKYFDLWVIGDEIADDFFFIHDIDCALDKLNSGLKYYRVELRSGYYTGAQLYVERKSDDIELPTDYTAEEWREARRGYLGEYYHEYKYSEAKRRELAERRKINRWMSTTGAALGFEQLFCVGVFSSGEAVYSRQEVTAC